MDGGGQGLKPIGPHGSINGLGDGVALEQTFDVVVGHNRGKMVALGPGPLRGMNLRPHGPACQFHS